YLEVIDNQFLLINVARRQNKFRRLQFCSKSRKVLCNCPAIASGGLSGDLPFLFKKLMMPMFDLVMCSATCAAVQLPAKGISLICVSVNDDINSSNSDAV